MLDLTTDGKSGQCSMAWLEVYLTLYLWGFSASEGAKDMIHYYPFCGILITLVNFLIVLLPFFLGSKNNQHLIPNRNYLIWCAQVNRISYLQLLALFWQKSQIIFWDALYTYCSCPAKGLAVCSWPQKVLLMTQVLCRTPKRQSWLTRRYQASPLCNLARREGEEVALAVPRGKVLGPRGSWPAAGYSMSRQKKNNSCPHVWDNTDGCCLQDMQRKAYP